MHNIAALFKNDMKHLFANVVCCIITIGLVVMPSIFAWYNIIACWNVFDNTGNIKVAVANEDAGYESDMVPLRINIGDMVVSALRANDQIGWIITEEEDAVDGASSGKYYAAVVIPEQFSRDMLRFYSDDSEHAQITYYANEKKNAISPKITATGADTVAEEVNTVFAQTLAEVMVSVVQSMSNYADEMDLDGQIGALANHIDDMGSDMGRVSSVIGMYNGALQGAQQLVQNSASLMQTASDDMRSALGEVSGSLEGVAEAKAALAEASEKMDSALEQAAGSFAEIRDRFENSGVVELVPADAREQIRQLYEDAYTKAQEVRDDFLTNIKPGIDEVTSGVNSLSNDAAQALEKLSQTESNVSGVAQALDGVFSNATDRISSVSQSLNESEAKLHELAQGIIGALAQGDTELLQTLLNSDVASLSTALSAPVSVERIAVFSSENFGSAMAPFYTTLAIFIGSLLILVVVKSKVSNEDQRALRNPKPRQMFVGRFGCMAVLSLAQTTLMGIGNLFFLGVQAAHPWLLMLCFWVSGLVFTFIIYALVLSFANLGKALAVCLLIVQVTGCGGSYPLQILPDFVQWLSPLLPATHAVGAMRAAMFGVYQGDFWMQMGYLLLFLIPAALIGFVLRKPFERFMKWYVERVESTNIIS